MKIKSKLLDTFESSFKRLYQIRSLIRDDKMDELSDEINEFYEENETLIKKWKSVIDFDSKTNPFPIEKKVFGAVPVFKDVPEELESIWRCSVNTDIDQRNSGDFYYLDILFYYQPFSSNSFSLIEAEIIEWTYNFEISDKRKFWGEDDSGYIFANTLSFNKGDNKKDLLAFAKLLFAFVYLGGELGSLKKIEANPEQ